MSSNEQVGPNTVERLRELLLQLYVSSPIRDDLSEADAIRLLDTMLAAGEGEPFALLDLPLEPASDDR